jgi:hypothetical protein
MARTHEIDEDVLNGMAREISELTERVKMLEPALRCADLLRELAAGRPVSWLEVADTLRALDTRRER